MGKGNFKVGDMVKVVSPLRTYSGYGDFMQKYAINFLSKWKKGYAPKESDVGTIVAVNKHENSSNMLAVVENKNHVFVIGVNGIEKIKHPVTIIYHKGRETIALLKDGNKVIKTAKAICNPKDEFNPDYGEKLAFARLHGLDEKVTDILLNGIKEVVVKTDGNFKARCIKTIDGSLTVGKVYEFKKGFSEFDSGTKMPNREIRGISQFRNFRDLEKWYGEHGNSKFEEVIEDAPVFAPTISRIVKQDKYEVGDKVKIISKSSSCTCERLERHYGDILTVKAFGGWSYDFEETADRLPGKDIEGKVIEDKPTQPTAPTFDWEGFRSGKIAVHCDTEEKAKQFLGELKIQGIKWCSGVELNKTNRWNEFRQETCYTAPDNGLEFSPERFYRREGFQIISYTPNYHEVKRPAKVGEWIKVINAKFIPTTNGKDDYKNGDILKVISLEFADKPRYSKGTGDNGNSRVLNHDEYIVLEPMAPTTNEPKPIDLALVSIDALLEELRKRVK